MRNCEGGVLYVVYIENNYHATLSAHVTLAQRVQQPDPRAAAQPDRKLLHECGVAGVT